MSNKKKMGRPIIGQPKEYRVEIRVDKECLDKLNKLAKEKKMTKSEFIRKVISEI